MSSASGKANAPTPVFDASHHAGTLRRKLWRASQLGSKYYLWDLPRLAIDEYFAGKGIKPLPLTTSSACVWL
jgi:hypothetical protein